MVWPSSESWESISARASREPVGGSARGARALPTLVESFKEMGGDVDFLRHLWKAQRPFKNRLPRVTAQERDKWSKVIASAQKLSASLASLVDPESIWDDREQVLMCDVVTLIGDWAHEHKEPVKHGRPSDGYLHRLYWCAALLPYFEFCGSAYKWPWLAAWMSLLGEDNTDSETLRQWWKQCVVKSLSAEQDKARRRGKPWKLPEESDPVRHARAFFRWKMGPKYSWTRQGKMFRLKRLKQRPLDTRLRKRYSQFIKREMPFAVVE